MGAWYWIGVSVGLGVGAGVVLSSFVGAARAALIAVAIVAGGAGAALGYGVESWQSGGWVDRLGGILGGLAGALATAQIVAGALRRGGTRFGTAALVAAGGILVAAFALVPVVGYLEVVALPALAVRIRRRQPERYAGLRTLARD